MPESNINRGVKMNEIETIARAQMYLEKLANGINPLTNENVAEDDIVNNVRISRCMFYVSGLLKRIVDNKGKYKAEMPERVPFSLTGEQLINFEFSNIPVSVSQITKRLNNMINPIYVMELKSGSITQWLTEINMLRNIVVNNRTRKHPTEAGIKIGITVKELVNQYGTPYEGVFYDLNAQHFIIDNIDAVIAVNNQKAKK